MPDAHALAERPSRGRPAVYDAVVIGTGISGMHRLYRLRELGMTARVFEPGAILGGAWCWNRYPGACSDSESCTCGYPFSKELMAECDWKGQFFPQPDTPKYLSRVADELDLLRDMELRRTVAAAHWDEAASQRKVTLETGFSAPHGG